MLLRGSSEELMLSPDGEGREPPPQFVAPDLMMGAVAAQQRYKPVQQPWLPDVGAPAIPSGPQLFEGTNAGRFVSETLPRAVGQAAVQAVATPGALMQPNPYPEGSEEWHWYNAQNRNIATQWGPEMAMNTMGTGAFARLLPGGVPGGATLGSAPVGSAKIPDNPRAVIGGNDPPTGSLNPFDNAEVSFGGKQPNQFTPEDWKAFGEHYQTDKPLGPLSPLETFKDMHGNEFQIPGGVGGEWTYYDLLHMKANPINPANVDRALHTEMQSKLGRTMTPKELTDADVWNGLVFGMTSPNNPLFPNQVSASRLRLRTPEMLDDLASMIPWKPGEEVTAQQRKLVNDQVAARLGIQSEPKGGIGTRGTADYSRVAEMAQLFKQNPAFFRKADNESWGQAVERISSQLPGLSMKTGSFGTVWQDPANAAISAIDRHMARELDKRGGIFASPEERVDWQNRSVKLWNKREDDRIVEEALKNDKLAEKGKKTREISPPDKATDWDDLLTKTGSDGFMGEMLLSHVGDAATPKFRDARTGEISKAIPQHLAQAQWVREPESVFKMGRAYKQALEVNQKIADEHGLNLFMSQWMEWDRIRNRFEPHENMFPGLSKVPAMSVEQLRGVNEAHRDTGHKTYNKTDEGALRPTRPYLGNASQMGYLGIGGLAAVPAVQQYQDYIERGR